MHVDDSRDRIFIHNLDDEIADDEPSEERLIFLPDIEKRFTNIPKSLLEAHGPPLSGNELVLYSVPESLTVPKEQDIVRKAIIESRQRALDKQVLNTKQATVVSDAEQMSTQAREDAMDID